VTVSPTLLEAHVLDAGDEVTDLANAEALGQGRLGALTPISSTSCALVLIIMIFRGLEPGSIMRT
jgi:hypothetical protein